MKIHRSKVSGGVGRWIILFAFILPLISVNLFPAVPVEADSGTIGIVADENGYVHIFNTMTQAVLGTVSIPITKDGLMGDCCISRDGYYGFVTDFEYRLWVIDLTQRPPVLASGINPIPISTPGEDVVTTPDGKFVVVVDGTGGISIPVSVVDIGSRSEVCTLAINNNQCSVDALNDGSILVTYFDDDDPLNNSLLNRLTIDFNGQLHNTGEVLSVPFPNNVYGAPNARSGILVKYSGTFISFLNPGLSQVDFRYLPGHGVCGAIDQAGTRIYVRSTHWDGPNQSMVLAYTFNSATGAVGANPLFTIPVADCGNYFGIDQMALSYNGDKLYVPEGNCIKIYDAATGSYLSSITDASFGILNGIYLQQPVTPGVPAANTWIFMGVFAGALAIVGGLALKRTLSKAER